MDLEIGKVFLQHNRHGTGTAAIVEEFDVGNTKIIIILKSLQKFKGQWDCQAFNLGVSLGEPDCAPSFNVVSWFFRHFLNGNLSIRSQDAQKKEESGSMRQEKVR